MNTRDRVTSWLIEESRYDFADYPPEVTADTHRCYVRCGCPGCYGEFTKYHASQMIEHGLKPSDPWPEEWCENSELRRREREEARREMMRDADVRARLEASIARTERRIETGEAVTDLFKGE